MAKRTISVSSNGRTSTVERDFLGDSPEEQQTAFGASVIAEASERTFLNRIKGSIQSWLDSMVDGESRYSEKEITKLANNYTPSVPAKRRSDVDKAVALSQDMNPQELENLISQLTAQAEA